MCFRVTSDKTNGDEGNRTLSLALSKTAISQGRCAKSGARNAPEPLKDAELELVNKLWPELTSQAKKKIVELVKSESKRIEYAVNNRFEKR